MDFSTDAAPPNQEIHSSHKTSFLKEISKDCFIDENQVRYQRIASNKKGKNYNWLFFPGGPGANSSYLRSLTDLLDLPGTIWLIDLPGNGDNTQNLPADYDYDLWFKAFLPAVQRFQNPILVGHSFGGMFPLCFPELEKKLKGLIILNSAPCLWLQEAVAYAQQYHLPDLTKEMTEFTLTPNETTFKAALDACMPYYFPEATLEKGRELLADVPFQFLPAVWWQRKAIEMNFTAQWIPENVPTLILSGTYDCIVPHFLFEKDERFHKPTIEMVNIDDGGHMPWIENPDKVKTAFRKFCNRF